MVRELRSDHAGETGAVYIYKGIRAVARWRQDAELLAFARQHGDTEAEHLHLMEDWLPAERRSRLLVPWRMAGWMTGRCPHCLAAAPFTAPSPPSRPLSMCITNSKLITYNSTAALKACCHCSCTVRPMNCTTATKPPPWLARTRPGFCVCGAPWSVRDQLRLWCWPGGCEVWRTGSKACTTVKTRLWACRSSWVGAFRSDIFGAPPPFENVASRRDGFRTVKAPTYGKSGSCHRGSGRKPRALC